MAVFKRIATKRGHLFPSKDSLLPVEWLRSSSTSLHQYLSTSTLFVATPDQTYFWVQGLWGSYTGASSEKQVYDRRNVEKRAREAGALEVMQQCIHPCTS